MAANKVEFGISNLHIGEYIVADDGTVTMGTPYHLPGAKNFAPEQDSNNNVAYADDIVYWSEYTDGPFEGDLEVMLFTDEFKTRFLGYKEMTGGGLAAINNAKKPAVYICFDIKGDAEGRRAMFYNCSLGAITREYASIEEEKEPATETIGVTCTGDNVTGATKVTFKPDDANYNTLYTAPPAPAFPAESE